MPKPDNIIRITRVLGDQTATAQAVYDEDRDCWECYAKCGNETDSRTTAGAWDELQDMLNCVMDR